MYQILMFKSKEVNRLNVKVKVKKTLAKHTQTVGAASSFASVYT